MSNVLSDHAMNSCIVMDEHPGHPAHAVVSHSLRATLTHRSHVAWIDVAYSFSSRQRSRVWCRTLEGHSCLA
jgi:hypothetical protein